MRIGTQVGLCRATLFAALGVGVIAACGGVTDSTAGTGGTPGNTGGTGGAGGTAGNTGGAGGSGGTTPTGGAGGLTTSGGTHQGTGGSKEPIEPGGYQKTPEGFTHRPQKGKCEARLPEPTRSPQAEGGIEDAGSGTPAPFPGDQCAYDDECADGLYGRCAVVQKYGGTGGLYSYKQCVYGCIDDTQCGTGQVCLCGPEIGTCVASTCAIDSECPGELCLVSKKPSVCGPAVVSYSLGCGVRPEGFCRTPDDCSSGASCTGDMCVRPSPCGRPFLVDGQDRRAAAIRRSDFARALAPDVSGLSASQRASLAEHWKDVGAMEHASVAAFARFALELLALGAPPELLEATHAALADELEHTLLAFGLATAYGGEAIGPGPLAMDRALAETSFVEIVRNAFLEACVGETCAAIEAREALEASSDPAVRAVLARIADDEMRHAMLGYRFVRWALETSSPSVRSELRSALCSALAALSLDAAPEGAECESSPLTAHGLLPVAARQASQKLALVHVVAPLTRTLLLEPHVRARDEFVHLLAV